MRKALAIGIGLLLCVSLAQAQYTSRLGRFQVDEVKGCAPFTITLTNLLAGECTAGKPCSMDYEEKGGQQNLFTYTYNTPGTFKLSVLYQAIGADDITITVDENIVPDFEIYSCSGNGVNIKVLEKSYDQFVIDFTNDGIPETIIPSGNNAIAAHAYGSSGGKVITVRGRDLNSADNCATNTQNFNALAVLPAAVISKLTTIDETSLQLDFNTQQHIQYRLEIAVNNSATFQLYKILYEPTTLVIPNLKTEENYYCFRLSSYDPCNNTNIYSNTICSQKFSLAIESGVNKLAWTTSSTGIQSIRIDRNDASYTTIPGTPSSFNDIDIDCKTNYCYRVINQYAGGVTSTSLQKCGVAFKTAAPPAIINASAVVNEQGNGVDLVWQQDPSSNPPSYFVLRSENKGTFFQIATNPTTNFKDPTYFVDGNFAYRIAYKDECDNSSPLGSIIYPIRLFGDIDKNIITIRWNSYKGWDKDVNNYVIEKYNQEGNLIQSINAGLDTTYVDDVVDPDNQVVTYRIRANAVQAGLSASKSNSITFTKDSNIFSPTAFSPNGDKLNDIFKVSGQYIVKMELSIFNRWGEMIYNSDKSDTWDGTFNGKAAEEDAYIWSVQVTDLAGRTFKESGTVALLRRGK